MDKFKNWFLDILGYVVSAVCVYFPHSCEEWTKVFAMLITIVTLFFITLPKAWPNIKKFLRWQNG